MSQSTRMHERKLQRLRPELAKGDVDLAAGRTVVISSDEELRELFARLEAPEKSPGRRGVPRLPGSRDCE